MSLPHFVYLFYRIWVTCTFEGGWTVGYSQLNDLMNKAATTASSSASTGTNEYLWRVSKTNNTWSMNSSAQFHGAQVCNLVCFLHDTGNLAGEDRAARGKSFSAWGQAGGVMACFRLCGNCQRCCKSKIGVDIAIWQAKFGVEKLEHCLQSVYWMY